jgi:hypothetical protein
LQREPFQSENNKSQLASLTKVIGSQDVALSKRLSDGIDTASSGAFDAYQRSTDWFTGGAGMAGIYESAEKDEFQAIAEAVGDCIHSWCRLEEALVAVLSWVLNTPQRKAGIIFATVTGFAVKLDFINELMEDELEEREEIKFWRGMVINLRLLASARNVLAHHSPVTRFAGDAEDPSKWRSVISPNTYDVRRRMEKRRGFTLVDVQCLAADIKRHEGLLGDLVCHLDETQVEANIFCHELKKIELHNELKDYPALARKTKKSRARVKRRPPIVIDPRWDEAKLKEILRDYLGEET